MKIHTIQLPDIQLGYVDQGSGPVVVLLHGFPLDHTMWSGQIEVLSAVSRVIAPDLRGFGASTLAPTDGANGVEMQRYASDVVALLDQLGVAEPVILCGFSMGGYIMWQIALQNPERVKALVACDTRAVADSEEARAGRLKSAEEVMNTGIEPILEAMLPKLLAEETRTSRPEVVELVSATIRQSSPDAVAAALRGMASRPDVTAELGSLSQPALVLAGEEDAISSPEEMRQIAVALPRGEFVEIPGAGHMTTVENPGAVNKALLTFIEQVSS